MENISTIKDRILTFLESEGIKKADFYSITGISDSNFKGKNLSSQLGGDAIVKVLTSYPNLSADWLLTGKGNMLIKAIPLHDRLAYLRNVIKNDHVAAQSLEIKDTSLIDCTDYLIAPKEKINFDRFLSNFPEFNEDWLKNGIGSPFGEKNEDKMIDSIQDRVYKEHTLPETNAIIEEGLSAKKTSDQKIGIPLIPLSAMAGAFTGETTVMEYECERYVIPAFKQAEYLIQVKGDSMQPTYYPGDLVACQRVPMGDVFFQWNKTYVLDTNQGPLIKRILPGSDADHISIVSDNTKYLPFELSKDQINGIALVCGIVRLE